MSQETIARILSIERQASRLRDDAQSQAQDLVSQAEKAAADTRAQLLAKAREESEHISQAAVEAAQAERTQVVARAEAEAQELEALAAQHLDQAVAFVIRQVAGRE